MGRCKLCLALLVLITGCRFDEDVPRYRKVLDGPHPATMPVFGMDEPLTLIRALQIANKDNEAINISGESYIQALSQKMKDAGTFLPTLSLAPFYSLSKGGSGGFSFGTTGGSSSTSSFTLTPNTGGLNHSFSVPLGASATGSLANASTFDAAGKTADQRQLLLLDERETILLQVVQSYYTCLKDERQVAGL